jgi:hypothetical protein
MADSWKLTGNVLIACNCDWGCPCNFNALPSRGHCSGGWLWMIDDGQIGGVQVGGLGVALYAKWPGAIHEGGGRAVCYVDERADPSQREALTRLLGGTLGGPWGIFINTYELSAPELARFDVHLDAYATRATVGASVELELQTIRNPVTNVVVHPEVVLPEGLVLKRGALAASKRFRVRGAIDYDHSGQYAAFGRFDYAA